MDATETGPLFSEVGQLVIQEIRDRANDIFLYAEVEPGVVAASIFEDSNDKVFYRRCSGELFDKILESWEALEPNKRWTTLTYTMTGERFSASFQFLEELDPAEDHDDRRERVLKERYGDKPIDYSDP